MAAGVGEAGARGSVAACVAGVVEAAPAAGVGVGCVDARGATMKLGGAEGTDVTVGVGPPGPCAESPQAANARTPRAMSAWRRLRVRPSRKC